MRTVTYQEWFAEGVRRFGPDVMDWRYVCPSCGHIASMRDWKNAGAKPAEVAYSCVGRHLEGSGEAFGKLQPCNYAGGGLIRLNPVHVITEPDGHVRETFEFAPEQPQAAPAKGDQA